MEALGVSSFGDAPIMVVSRRSARNSKKSPLKSLTVGGGGVPMAELDLNADEVPKVHVFGVENFSTPPSSPDRSVGKGNEDSVTAPAPKWEIGQACQSCSKRRGYPAVYWKNALSV